MRACVRRENFSVYVIRGIMFNAKDRVDMNGWETCTMVF